MSNQTGAPTIGAYRVGLTPIVAFVIAGASFLAPLLASGFSSEGNSMGSISYGGFLLLLFVHVGCLIVGFAYLAERTGFGSLVVGSVASGVAVAGLLGIIVATLLPLTPHTELLAWIAPFTLGVGMFVLLKFFAHRARSGGVEFLYQVIGYLVITAMILLFLFLLLMPLIAYPV